MTRHSDVEAAVAAARGLGLTEFDEDSAARRAHGRGGVDRRGDAGSARGADAGAARFRGAAGRSGARRARHRHGHLPQRRREDSRHREPRRRERSGGRSNSRGRGEKVDYAAVLADIARRDARDAERADAPMRAAADAVKIDTTQFERRGGIRERAMQVVESRRALARASPWTTRPSRRERRRS